MATLCTRNVNILLLVDCLVIIGVIVGNNINLFKFPLTSFNSPVKSRATTFKSQKTKYSLYALYQLGLQRRNKLIRFRKVCLCLKLFVPGVVG